MIGLNVLCNANGPDYENASAILLLAALGIMVIGLILQSVLKSVFNKYSRVRTSKGVSANDVISDILYKHNCSASITATGGMLTDHYNPRSNTIALSEPVYNKSSIAALAVAAHETGHALQHKDGYFMIKLRDFILPAAQIGSSFAPILVLMGFLFEFFDLAIIGVILYSAVFLFQLITLPVEFNASARAMRLLTEGGYIEHSEAHGARKVLTMAAMTYVISTLATLVTLLRLLLIATSSRRD